MVREFTESEAQQIYEAEKGLRESGLDVDHGYAIQNSNLILDYFDKNPGVPVTVASIYAFVEKKKNQFVWRTPAQREYDKVAAEDTAKAQQVSDWLANQTSLVKTGDQGFQNASSILQELRGRAVTTQTIQNAIDLIGAPSSKFHAARRPLHFVQAARRTEPRSEAAKNDADYKPGQLFSSERANEPQWVRLARERSEREAREAVSNPSDATMRSRAVAEARAKAESIATPSAAETEQLRKLFVTTPGTSEIDWPSTLASRERLQQQFTKAREVRRFIR